MAAELQVAEFQIAWNPKLGKGLVQFKYTNGQGHKFEVNSLGDLAGWAALFNEKPLYVNAQGWMHTGNEPVGE